MKKLLLILAVLVAIFVGVWTVKLRTPITPADPFANGTSDETPWWETSNGEAPTPDEAWVLDHEIPDNYIPVLGGNELYMVIGEDGKVIKYRQRAKQEDGSWTWEDIDPNIPQNYVPVEGLENVYSVTEIDGTVRYYLYTRNDDDTYFFTEVDEHGKPLRDTTPANDEIPANFIRVDGTNIYAVYNEYGVLVGYKERIREEDGTYRWVDAEAPAQKNNQPSQGNTIPVGEGGIPSVSGGQTGGDINIIASDPDNPEKGYIEEQSYTDIRHENGWCIVYETLVRRTYDAQGNLISTKKEGPTEINRFPESELSKEVLK